MKTVKIIVVKDGVESSIEVTFSGDVMPDNLDHFITEHVGTRPPRER